MTATATKSKKRTSSRQEDFRKELNGEQYRVVTEGDGACLVLAGAGSGKTRTVVYRVAHLINNGVRPEEILLLTFTNKAAGEMMGRIGTLLGQRGGPAGVWGGTFHSVANRLLRMHAERLGFTKGFTILDQEDSRSMVKASIKELGLDSKERRFPSPKVIHSVGSYAKNAMLSVAATIERKHPDFQYIERDIVSVLETYDHKKRLANAMDFDDLLLHLYGLLTDEHDLRRSISDRFRYVLVDEYQDTNALQDGIVRLISEKHGNVLVVGDDAQSIYSFRAADIRNILEFSDRFPGAKRFMLETNYRSTPEVLDLANDVISRNKKQFPKELKAVNDGSSMPKVVPASSAAAEAEYVADKIEGLIDGGKDPRDIAVLFRATHHSQALEFELMRRGVEYDYRGGMRFFERAHVKDVLAFLRIAYNFADEAAWRRVLNFQRGIGDVTAGKVYVAAMRIGSLSAVAEHDMQDTLGKKALLGWGDLRKTLLKLVKAGERPFDMIKAILDSPYDDYLTAEYPNARERMDDLEQLAAFSDDYDDADEFLAEVALNDAVYAGVSKAGSGRREAGSAGRRVVLSTVHQAKGLEWDKVFIIHLTSSGFPNRRAAMEEGGIEEERRLFYVAVTRAKKSLTLCYPRRAGFDSSAEFPSMFITEADPTNLDIMEEGRGAFASDCGDTYLNYNDDEDGVIELDEHGDMREVKKRVADWKKKSFLRDI
ncbi:MAG: ATP-dependent helicase [Patescibacteria group bacterium]|nr:ATP-dependent helicase [Patescibacteria group bacterium]